MTACRQTKTTAGARQAKNNTSHETRQQKTKKTTIRKTDRNQRAEEEYIDWHCATQGRESIKKESLRNYKPKQKKQRTIQVAATQGNATQDTTTREASHRQNTRTQRTEEEKETPPDEIKISQPVRAEAEKGTRETSTTKEAMQIKTDRPLQEAQRQLYLQTRKKQKRTTKNIDGEEDGHAEQLKTTDQEQNNHWGTDFPRPTTATWTGRNRTERRRHHATGRQVTAGNCRTKPCTRKTRDTKAEPMATADTENDAQEPVTQAPHQPDQIEEILERLLVAEEGEREKIERSDPDAAKNKTAAAAEKTLQKTKEENQRKERTNWSRTNRTP